MISVFLPSQLESYTGNVREVTLDIVAPEAGSLTLVDVIAGLEKQFRGLAFRIIDEHGNIRRHIAIFVGETMVRKLDVPLSGNERVQIVGALSGG